MAKSTEKRKNVGLFQRFFHASLSTFPPFPTFSAFANFYNRKIVFWLDCFFLVFFGNSFVFPRLVRTLEPYSSAVRF